MGKGSLRGWPAPDTDPATAAAQLLHRDRTRVASAGAVAGTGATIVVALECGERVKGKADCFTQFTVCTLAGCKKTRELSGRTTE